MKTILKSTLMIIAASAIVGGATKAYFTDTATISGNTFSAGTLDLKIDSNPSPSVATWENGFTNPYNPFAKIKPGDKGEQIIDIKNEGNVDGNATIKLSRTSAWNELASKLTFTMLYDAENDGTFVETGVSGALDAFTGIYALGTLPAGRISSVKILWSVPTSAGNEIQGDSVTFNAVFGIEQTH